MVRKLVEAHATRENSFPALSKQNENSEIPVTCEDVDISIDPLIYKVPNLYEDMGKAQ
jgi:hypothetical protein